MKLNWMGSWCIVLMVWISGVLTAAAQPSLAVGTKPVFVPDTSHASGPLPDGVLAWDELMKSVDATNGQTFARFAFNFTNIATTLQPGWATNITVMTNITVVTNKSFWGKKIAHVATVSSQTNILAFTNSQPVPVTILAVHPSCGCTTAELPPVPWTIPPGSCGEIKLSVNLAGKSGTLFKTVNISTDQGNKTLTLKINILPSAIPMMTDADRARALELAKVDRQAVLKDDCAVCHVKPGEGKFGKDLFAAVCSVCHESHNRASMVPDLHAIKTPTNEDFWRTWITHGKPGSLMPAFSTSEGGTLNDMQITSLAAYLNTAIPSKVPPPPQ